MEHETDNGNLYRTEKWGNGAVTWDKKPVESRSGVCDESKKRNMKLETEAGRSKKHDGHYSVFGDNCRTYAKDQM